MCLVAASKSGEASPRHRRTLDNPLVQMDVKQSHSVDGHGASPWQRQIRGKPTVQTRGILRALTDTGHPHGAEGCGTCPRHRRMQGIPMAQADAGHPRGREAGTRTEGFSRTCEPPHHQITAGSGSPQGTAGQAARAAAPPPHCCCLLPVRCLRKRSDGSLPLARDHLSKSLIKSSFIL